VSAPASTASPLVSCIVPVFNGERFLAEALQSIHAQTHRELEILVVDDGSTDGTPGIIASQGDRVSSLRQPNRGQGAARNAGVRAARGELIAFLDADDLWEPEKLGLQIARLAAHPALDLCFTQFQNFWVPELADEAHHHRDESVAQPSAAWSIGTLLAPRAVFDRFGPFDETLKLGPNITWFLRAAQQGARIEVLPDILMRRRLHPGNTTRKDLEGGYDELIPILRAWRDYRRGSPRP